MIKIQSQTTIVSPQVAYNWEQMAEITKNHQKLSFLAISRSQIKNYAANENVMIDFFVWKVVCNVFIHFADLKKKL